MVALVPGRAAGLAERGAARQRAPVQQSASLEFCGPAHAGQPDDPDGLSAARPRQRWATVPGLRSAEAINPLEWTPRHLAQAGESWYQQIGRTGLHAVRNSFSASQLDEMLMTIPAPQPVEPQKRSDILDVIGYDEDGQSTLGWPQAAECFDPLRQTSYWWTNRCDGYPLYTHVHSGNFTGQLFTLLFDPAGGARPGRHGLYPPMFE